MQTRSNQLLTVVLALTASIAYGGVLTINVPGENGLTFSGIVYKSPVANPDVLGFEALETAMTYDLFATTPADVLVIDFTLDVSLGSVFHDRITDAPYGTVFDRDNGPAPAGAIANNPQLGADSWVTTPGAGTACAQIGGACPGFENAGQVSHFDSSQDGAQTDFQFARITIVPDETGSYLADFTGYVQVANQPSPIVEPFSYRMTAIPEPDSFALQLIALLSGFAIIRKRRRVQKRRRT